MRPRARIFYPVLQAEMDKRGISRRDVAEALYYGRNTVDHLMRGDTNFKLRMAKELRDKLFPDMTLDELFKTAEEMEGVSDNGT